MTKLVFLAKKEKKTKLVSIENYIVLRKISCILLSYFTKKKCIMNRFFLSANNNFK